MIEPKPGRRLVVALPAEEAALELLCAAADLALRLERECVGLLVESEALAAAAALPFVRAVPVRGTGGASFDPASSRRALHVLAERARKRLGAHAGAAQLRWSLQIVEGRLESLALRAEDLLALGPIDPLGPGLASAELSLPCPMIMVTGMHGPILLLFAGARETLELGRTLAAAERRQLEVAAIEDGLSSAPELAEIAREHLGADVAPSQVRALDLGGIEALVQAIRPSLVVIDSCGAAGLWQRVLHAVRSVRRQVDLHQGQAVPRR